MEERDRLVLQEVSQAVSRMLMGRRTFYAHVLVRMRREVSRQVPTMAVRVGADGVELLINPDFWSAVLVTDDLREGVLVHEVLHVVLRHLIRKDAVTDFETFNIAADLAVNRLVGRRFLPNGALFVEDMPEEWGLPEDAAAETYYELLRERASRQDLIALGNGAVRGSHSTWPGSSHGSRAATAASSTCEGVVRSTINGLVQAAIRDTHATRGEMPAGLERAVAAFSPKKSTTNWRRMMHLFGASGTTTFLKPTIMSPSRRFGTVPGIRVRQRRSLAVAIDTSGSVADDLLAAFFGEVHAIWRVGVEVTVIECDAAIAADGVWTYRGRHQRRTQGGGGTDFDPPIGWVNSKPVDGLVYLTDGHGSRSLPCRRRVLWMVTDRDNLQPNAGFALPGEAVCLLDVEAAGSP